MQVARRLTAVIIWILAIVIMLWVIGVSSDNDDPSGFFSAFIVAVIALALNLAFNWVFADKKENGE